MLYVVLNGGDETITWNVESKINRISSSEVLQVTADGYELEWIKENFENIPYHKIKPIQTWTGDIAAFIASCLPQR